MTGDNLETPLDGEIKKQLIIYKVFRAEMKMKISEFQKRLWGINSMEGGFIRYIKNLKYYNSHTLGYTHFPH